MRNLIYLGASFATTNPPLVNMVWDILPNTLNPLCEKIILTNPDADSQGKA
jgi:hypothetical protein